MAMFISLGTFGWVIVVAIALVGAGWWWSRKADRFIDKKRPGQ